jgi:hypothetical protein
LKIANPHLASFDRLAIFNFAWEQPDSFGMALAKI